MACPGSASLCGIRAAGGGTTVVRGYALAGAVALALCVPSSGVAAASGALTQLKGEHGCVSNEDDDGCTVGARPSHGRGAQL